MLSFSETYNCRSFEREIRQQGSSKLLARIYYMKIHKIIFRKCDHYNVLFLRCQVIISAGYYPGSGWSSGLNTGKSLLRNSEQLRQEEILKENRLRIGEFTRSFEETSGPEFSSFDACCMLILTDQRVHWTSSQVDNQMHRSRNYDCALENL